MAYVRKWGEDHISKSLKQIDSETWLIGDLVLHRSPYPSDVATCNDDSDNPSDVATCNDDSDNPSDVATWKDDSDNSSYTLTEAPTPLPSATTPPDSPYIKLIYKAGDARAIWSIGNSVVCKAAYTMEGITPESVSLNFVRDQQPSTFETPKVLHHAFASDRSFLFYQRLPGRTLLAAWPNLDEYWRSKYVTAVVDACMEMAEWKGQVFGGVDGQNLPEYYLHLTRLEGAEGFSSTNLQASCELLGMDCSNLVFSHNCLAPETIIVEDEPRSGKIGLIAWGIAGYLPRTWIRTKCPIFASMYLPPEVADRSWFAREVTIALGVDGFDEVVEAYRKWLPSKH